MVKGINVKGESRRDPADGSMGLGAGGRGEMNGTRGTRTVGERIKSG